MGSSPGLPRLGLCPFSASGEGRDPKARAAGAAALLRQICSLTALAGSVPTASAYWRYRWVLIMPSALAAIQMLKLFICSWVSSRQRQKSEWLPSAMAALLPLSAPWDAAPQAQAGTDPAVSISAFLSWGGPAAPQPWPPLSAPFSWGDGCRLPGHGSVVARVQPISPSADFPP